MKEKYIQEVKKRLCVPRKQRDEIVRDLLEAFESAAEHGQTEAELIERLGAPQSYADNIHEQLGLPSSKRQKREGILPIAGALIAAAAAIGAGFWIRMLRSFPEGAIGQADAATSIQVVGPAVDPCSSSCLAPLHWSLRPFWLCGISAAGKATRGKEDEASCTHSALARSRLGFDAVRRMFGQQHFGKQQNRLELVRLGAALSERMAGK